MMLTRELSSCSVLVAHCNHTTIMVVASHYHNHVTTGVDKEGLHMHEPL